MIAKHKFRVDLKHLSNGHVGRTFLQPRQIPIAPFAPSRLINKHIGHRLPFYTCGLCGGCGVAESAPKNSEIHLLVGKQLKQIVEQCFVVTRTSCILLFFYAQFIQKANFPTFGKGSLIRLQSFHGQILFLDEWHQSLGQTK